MFTVSLINSKINVVIQCVVYLVLIEFCNCLFGSFTEAILSPCQRTAHPVFECIHMLKSVNEFKSLKESIILLENATIHKLPHEAVA